MGHCNWISGIYTVEDGIEKYVEQSSEITALREIISSKLNGEEYLFLDGDINPDLKNRIEELKIANRL